MNEHCPSLADSVCVAGVCHNPGPCPAKDKTGRPVTAFEFMGKRHNSNRRHRVPKPPSMDQKYCPACDKVKQLHEFGGDIHAPSKKYSYCIKCTRAKSKARWKKRKTDIDKAQGYHGRLNDDL